MTSDNCKICGSIKYTCIVSEIRDWEYGFPGSFDYLQCSSCKVVQISPFPTISDLKKAYEVDYHGFAIPSSKGKLYSALYKIVEQRTIADLTFGLDKNAKILDVGCGVGLLLSKLKRLGFSNLEGIDFNATAVQAVNSLDIPCYHGTFLDHAAPDGTYDLIMMNNYLEHTLNPKLELEKVHRLLKPQGIIVGEIPNFNSIGRLLFGRYWGGNHIPRHTFQFTPSSLIQVLQQSEFTSCKLYSPLNTSHLALSVQNFFQRNKNLVNNPNLVHGRVAYYSLLMIAAIPINFFAKLIHRACFLRFRAIKS